MKRDGRPMDRSFYVVAIRLLVHHLLHRRHCCTLLSYPLAAPDTICGVVDLAAVEVHALASIPS